MYFTYISEEVVLLGALGISSIHQRIQQEESWFHGVHIDIAFQNASESELNARVVEGFSHLYSLAIVGL